MRRDADQQLLTNPPAYRVHRLVVLTDVHAIGPARERQIGAVVQDQKRAVAVADLAQPAPARDDVVVVQLLFTQLDHIDAARERVRHHARRSGRLDDEVEPCGLEPRTPIAAAHAADPDRRDYRLAEPVARLVRPPDTNRYCRFVAPESVSTRSK